MRKAEQTNRKTRWPGRVAIALLAAFGVAALSGGTHAAQGTLEQRRACRADAMKFCRQFVPNVSDITACMERNKRSLSPACRAQFK